MANPSILLPLILSTLSAAQSPRSDNPAVLLEITSPANGAIVEPGQRLSVTVNSSQTIRDAQFAVISPLGDSGLMSSLPGRAIIEIAKDAACGRTALTAFGRARGGQEIVSNPIEIDVERPDTPTAISERNHMSHLEFTERGTQIPMSIVATFADGVVLYVDESSHMTYSSSSPQVAAVSDFGMITAMGVGKATIRAEYRNGAARRALEVYVDVPSLVLTVSPDALDFGAQAVGTTSAPRTLILKNTGSEPMTITAVHALGEFAASGPCIGSAPLSANATCALNITFTPTALGSRPSVVGIATDRTLPPDPIHVTGVGVRR
jgi:hypothetical protein